MFTMRLTGVLVLFFLLGLAGCRPENSGPRQSKSDYSRIISFAPNITETLFALGVGDRVVGVTSYCNYPPQAKNLPHIGGYFDPNYEMILSLKPDLVLLLPQHSPLVDFLKKNRIHYQVIENESVPLIMQSFRTIGTLCGKIKEADSICRSIGGEISDTASPLYRPKLLFCIARDNPGAGAISRVYVCGPKSFYSQLMYYAGGENAFKDSLFAYPTFSAEGIMRLAPEVIIDLMASVTNVPEEKVKADWNTLAKVPAVKNHLVFCPMGDFMTIPGPRIVLTLAEIKKTVLAYRNRTNE
jgi:iron complex transport system substrate-binding protein